MPRLLNRRTRPWRVGRAGEPRGSGCQATEARKRPAVDGASPASSQRGPRQPERASPKPSMSLSLTIGVEDEGAVVTGVVVPLSRRSVVTVASGERDAVELAYGRVVRHGKRHVHVLARLAAHEREQTVASRDVEALCLCVRDAESEDRARPSRRTASSRRDRRRGSGGGRSRCRLHVRDRGKQPRRCCRPGRSRRHRSSPRDTPAAHRAHTSLA